ncbi:hypothetical protein F5Y15DRAFT_389329 [Xylariaceae sp. FL0016]|nr:hypothetical protein F5Y15DRAFT_389329 [Xylariaceae sp. FL0016]
MASSIRSTRAFGAVSTTLRNQCRASCSSFDLSRFAIHARPLTKLTRPRCARSPPNKRASFHTYPPTRRQREFRGREDQEMTATDLEKMDVLGNTPVPATSVDICMSDGFQLNSGIKIMDGAGALLVGGEAFAWRPWESRTDGKLQLLNAKGQWDVPPESLGLLSLLWPRPDLLVLGLGPEIRPISPELRRFISSLGMRVEIIDTRNAAAQFNLLATERGVNDVAAALIPIGWKEGVGTNW